MYQKRLLIGLQWHGVEVKKISGWFKGQVHISCFLAPKRTYERAIPKDVYKRTRMLLTLPTQITRLWKHFMQDGWDSIPSGENSITRLLYAVVDKGPMCKNCNQPVVVKFTLMFFSHCCRKSRGWTIKPSQRHPISMERMWYTWLASKHTF